VLPFKRRIFSMAVVAGAPNSPLTVLLPGGVKPPSWAHALASVVGLDVVGRPEIHITKLASKNPVGLHIHTAVYPEVKLPKRSHEGKYNDQRSLAGRRFVEARY